MFEKIFVGVVVGLVVAVGSELTVGWVDKLFGEDDEPQPEIAIQAIEPVKDPDNEDGLPLLEVKVVNTGEQVAVISAAKIQVRKVWNLEPTLTEISGLLSSATYGALIAAEAPSEVRVPVSQSIAPNTADNFTIDIDLPEDEPDGTVVLVSVGLVYGTNVREVNQCVLLMKDDSRHTYLEVGEFSVEAYRANLALSKEIELEDAVRDPKVERRLTQILDRDPRPVSSIAGRGC